MKNMTQIGVHSVASDRDGLAFQIVVYFLCHIVVVSELNDQISFIISLKITNNIDFIEITELRVRTSISSGRRSLQIN